MYQKAEELAEANGWFLARQFETEANADIHEATTAREILADFEGQRLDYFVTGYGTGGTVAGVGRVLRRERPETKIILCEPANAQLVGSGTRAGARCRTAPRPRATPPSSRTRSRAGRRTSFRSCCRRRSTKHIYDELIPIAGAEGMKWAKMLAQKEGIFTGVSGGSTFGGRHASGREGARGLGDPRMLPDTGERYLSTPLFEGIREDMNEEEIALSRSTPGYQMG